MNGMAGASVTAEKRGFDLMTFYIAWRKPWWRQKSAVVVPLLQLVLLLRAKGLLLLLCSSVSLVLRKPSLKEGRLARCLHVGLHWRYFPLLNSGHVPTNLEGKRAARFCLNYQSRVDSEEVSQNIMHRFLTCIFCINYSWHLQSFLSAYCFVLLER